MLTNEQAIAWAQNATTKQLKDAKHDLECMIPLNVAQGRRLEAAMDELTERRTTPKELRNSEAYSANRDGAKALWSDGFRPIPAKDVEVGMRVAFRNTDVFQLGCVGPVHHATVYGIKPLGGDYRNGYVLAEGEEPWGFEIEHTGGTAEVDELDEIWAQPKTS